MATNLPPIEVAVTTVLNQEAKLTSDSAALLLHIPWSLENFDDPSAYYQGVRDLTDSPFLHRAETAHSIGGQKAMAALSAEYFVLNRVSDDVAVSSPRSVAGILEHYCDKIAEAGVARTRLGARRLIIDSLSESVDAVRMTEHEAAYTDRVLDALIESYGKQVNRRQKIAIAAGAAVSFGLYLYRHTKSAVD